MKMYELKCDKLSVEVASKGAELKSLKMNGREYMWSAAPEFWPRTSPVLFPFVGRLKGQQYTYNGVTYEPPAHGFARETEFELLEQTDNSLHFGMKDSQATKQVYPFSFEFEIIYTLDGNKLKVTFVVKNKDDKQMFFSLGGHPGFVCPFNNNEKRSQCYVHFEKDGACLEKVVSRGVDTNTGLVTYEYSDYMLEEGNLAIADDLFENDALVIEDSQVNKVSLLDASKKTYVTLEMDAPIYGIWSGVKPGAPFICIEPWFGRCDAIDFDGDLTMREHQNSLKPGEEFRTEYTVTLM